MPSPNKGEQRKDFISRCMSSQEAINTFPDSRQRAAFCYGQWEKKVKGSRLSGTVHQIKKDPLLEKPPIEQVKKRKKRG